MRAGLSSAMIAALVFGGSTAWAACSPGSSAGCVDFTQIPKISDNVVAAEKLSAPAKVAPISVKSPYTGPTVGVVPHSVGRAAEVGYRWAIN